MTPSSNTSALLFGFNGLSKRYAGLNLAVDDRHDIHLYYRYFDYMGLTVFHNPSGFTELTLIE
ncbi:MAG: hypothetical protein AAF843_04990 [Bacteroidota bacterium]